MYTNLITYLNKNIFSFSSVSQQDFIIKEKEKKKKRKAELGYSG
jgi:hypothetical protein